jgi:hypothetical protein
VGHTRYGGAGCTLRSDQQGFARVENSRLTGHTLGSARSSGLDLTVNLSAMPFAEAEILIPSPEGDGEVSDVGGLGLSGSVGSHDTPAVRLRELNTEQ